MQNGEPQKKKSSNLRPKPIIDLNKIFTLNPKSWTLT
jgi:hypothetical protein